ncbi:MAG: helix-hairpin-helix domain-containing protein [Lachnospiraceae bacterium]|nr:helix-hairpin-helix domain-containing protein [Lachnospiraceae bacterium]
MCGSVNSPGVVRIEKGDRLIDAVKAAGGFNEEADRNYLNLARVLQDGERIYVPSSLETALLTIKDVIRGSETGISEDKEEKDNIININMADVGELTTLPGIGESRAKDIIAYRNKVGAFEKKEDIKNVSGIGESLYARIVDLITVE